MSNPGAAPLEAVAIIGLAGRFPGARTVAELWQNLTAGIESIRSFTDEELRAAGVTDAALGNPRYVKAGTVLDGAAEFDAAFFAVNPREAEITDPQHRLFLECAQDALDSAGCDPARFAGLIGVFAGSAMSSYLSHNLARNPAVVDAVGELPVLVGNDKDFVPTRVAYKLNLRGPAVNVQTACSTSLVAVHLGCQALLDGSCDVALAGGVSVRFPQPAGYHFAEDGILSPDGHCRAFDADARGTVGGHGVGIVVLKRLSEAMRDGDFIWAVIKGSAINNDGAAKVGYTAPSVTGQAEVIEAALAAADVEPASVSYVEAHGTATRLGDPIEIAALTQAFRTGTDARGFCALGSVKTNLGHLDAAAGVTGLIKAVLQLHHRTLVPSLHYHTPNPAIDFASSPFFVNDRLRSWDGPRPLRAGVSSFGLGGTNAHLVLEESPAVGASQPHGRWQLLPLSARTPTALRQAMVELAAHLEQHPHLRVEDVAFTLQSGRTPRTERAAVVCRDRAEAVDALTAPGARARVAGRADAAGIKTAFLFPGGGAQHPNMGRGLYEGVPAYREAIDRCAERLGGALGLDIRTVMFPQAGEVKDAASALAQTALGLPALFITEYAQASLLVSWGLTPDALIGHSLGEYTAACIAGVLSLDDALAMVAARGRLMQQLPPGAMTAVSLPEDEAARLLGPEVAIAAVNGPALCVVSGLVGAIAEAERRLAAAGVDFQRLKVEVASHSPAVEPILAEFRDVVARCSRQAPRTPFVSNRSGTWITPAEATSPDYWVDHLRQPVRFADGLAALLASGDWVLVEAGPGRMLTSLAAVHPARTTRHVLATSMRHPHDEDDDVATAVKALGQVWCAGGAMAWDALNAGVQGRRVPLPTYPFERSRYWVDPAPEPSAATTGHGRADDPADWHYAPSWRQVLRAAGPTASAPATRFLLFLDQEGIGDQLRTTLAAEGTVDCVLRGTGFSRTAAGDYTIDPESPADYGALIQHLGSPPEVVVHLWSVSAGRSLDQVEAAGFYSLLYLAQALDDHAPQRRMAIHVVSSNMHRVAFEPDSAPEKATVLGPCRVVPQEYPHLTCASIDIDLADDTRATAARLAEMVRRPGEHSTSALRRGDLWVQQYEAVRLDAAPAAAAGLRAGSTYLLTGGLGGMALEIADDLTRHVGASVVLVGRSAFPDQVEWPAWIAAHGTDHPVSRKIGRLEQMRARGAEVVVARADVTDAAQMRGVWEEARRRFGRIDGVFHTAGLTGGGLIQLKSRDMARPVLDVKVRGTRVLHALAEEFGTDFLLLCSSLSAVVGGVGHVDYCGANAFLDTFAEAKRGEPGVHVVAVDWNAWRQIGMAVDLALPEALRAWRAEVHQSGISPPEGCDAIYRILASRLRHCAVSTEDLPALLRRNFSYTPPTARSADTHAAAGAHARPASAVEYVAPRTGVEGRLATLWQDLLGIAPIGIHDDFFQLGGHSLLGTRLISRLRETFQVTIGLRTLFEQPTLAALASQVEARERERDSAREAEVLRTIDELSDSEIEAELSRRLGSGGQ